jgi:hypothetical protein
VVTAKPGAGPRWLVGGLMSTASMAYFAGGAFSEAGGRRLNQLDSPQRGDAAGEALIGRHGELAAVQAFVERSRRDGEALVLFGEPGVGKTLFLDVAANMATSAGARVLRASGVEFEAGISFSGLNQALLQLFGEFGHLTASHRKALNVALGIGEGPPPDRLVVSSATLALLRQAA